MKWKCVCSLASPDLLLTRELIVFPFGRISLGSEFHGIAARNGRQNGGCCRYDLSIILYQVCIGFHRPLSRKRWHARGKKEASSKKLPKNAATCNPNQPTCVSFEVEKERKISLLQKCRSVIEVLAHAPLRHLNIALPLSSLLSRVPPKSMYFLFLLCQRKAGTPTWSTCLAYFVCVSSPIPSFAHILQYSAFFTYFSFFPLVSTISRRHFSCDDCIGISGSGYIASPMRRALDHPPVK